MKVRSSKVFAALILFGLAAPCRAGLVTGNPTADGWQNIGNSRTLGVYIRGDAGFNFDVYRTTFSLDTGSNLFNGTTWLAGDTIVGIGADFLPFSPSDLSGSTRLIAKFGTSTATFSASSVPPDNSPGQTGNGVGDGNGSLSGGHGGTGALELGTNTGTITAGNANTVRTFDYAFRDTGAFSSLATFDFGRYIYTTVAPGSPNLESMEVFLNISQLARVGLDSPGPQPGDKFDLAFQRSNNAYLDALGTTATLSAVPEPSSIALLATALPMGLGLAWKRRRKAMVTIID